MKSEARNSKSETISNDQNPKLQNFTVWNIWTFEFGICFELRYSNFEF
jgi:hypothetical protein